MSILFQTHQLEAWFYQCPLAWSWSVVSSSHVLWTNGGQVDSTRWVVHVAKHGGCMRKPNLLWWSSVLCSLCSRLIMYTMNRIRTRFCSFYSLSEVLRIRNCSYDKVYGLKLYTYYQFKQQYYRSPTLVTREAYGQFCILTTWRS